MWLALHKAQNKEQIEFKKAKILKCANMLSSYQSF
jgi:hypothetical protein